MALVLLLGEELEHGAMTDIVDLAGFELEIVELETVVAVAILGSIKDDIGLADTLIRGVVVAGNANI